MGGVRQGGGRREDARRGGPVRVNVGLTGVARLLTACLPNCPPHCMLPPSNRLHCQLPPPLVAPAPPPVLAPGLMDSVHTAMMAYRLYAPLPMMQAGPNSPVSWSRVSSISTMASRILWSKAGERWSSSDSSPE